MRLDSIFRILVLLALPLSFYTQGSASSLQGKVVDVIDGERLMVLSSNQPVKVKLIGVAAPTNNQPFSAEAKQHLADLASGKYVVVHYTSLNHEGFVVGRVVTKDMDVGEQMIRDGVAWYDKNDGVSLSEMEKQGITDRNRQLEAKVGVYGTIRRHSRRGNFVGSKSQTTI